MGLSITNIKCTMAVLLQHALKSGRPERRYLDWHPTEV